MYRRLGPKRGIALLLVLATVLVVVILANITLRIALSRSRLSYHQISRVQAYYVAKAAENLAIERLRTGAWVAASCPNPGGCAVADASFPQTITAVRVVFCPSGVACNGLPVCNPPAVVPPLAFCVQATATYTANP